MKEVFKAYPNKLQSWGIVGLFILISIGGELAKYGVVKLGASIDLSFLIGYVFTMGIVFLIVNYLRKKKDTTPFDFQFPPIKILVLSILVLLGIQIGISQPIAASIPMNDFFEKILLEIMKHSGIFMVIAAVILAPIFEELIFRGIILKGLLKNYTPQTAILLSAFLFGLIHLNPWQFVGAFMLGLLFGWLYYKTQNLLLCILLHFFNNGLAMLMSQASMTPEEMIDMSYTEALGGLTNVILIVVGSLVVGVVSFLTLKNQLSNKQHIEL